MPRLEPESLGQYLDALFRAAWGLCGSREDAEDLVQDTIARILARPRTVKAGGERAYLLSALRNTFYSRLRQRSRRPRTGAELEPDAAVETRTSVLPVQALEAREVFAAIAELPEDFRLALVAVDILGLSYAEAGAALGCREATLTTRIYRARQRIARAVAPEREASGSDRSLA